MFNPEELSKEIFSVLRSFNYTVNIFDYDGNKVYEPEKARRFFASPKNITVSISDEGENSTIKMFVSQSTPINEISGLVQTLRTIAVKFGLLFNVRKYEKELRPKDLAPESDIEYESGTKLSDDTKEKNHLDTITHELKSLKSEFVNIVKHMKKEKVAESMTQINEKETPTMELPALGCWVEIDAWNAFKEDHTLELYHKPEAFSEDQFPNKTAETVLKLKAVADVTKADGMANMFSRVADAIEHGAKDKLLFAIADRAIKAGYDTELTEARHEEMIHLPAVGVDVEKNAWEDFKNGKLHLNKTVDFEHKLGATANPKAFYLRQIANACSADGMANMFIHVADALENGNTTPLFRHIAKMAISAAKSGGQADISESIIVTESIKEFGDWFDTLTSTTLFEQASFVGDEDKTRDALDVAYKYVEENFNVDDFLASDDAKILHYSDDDIPEDEKNVDENDIKSCMFSYIEKSLEQMLDGFEYPVKRDIYNLVDHFYPDVESAFDDAGFDIDDGNLTESDELTSEDVLLPKNVSKDFTNDVAVHHQKDDPDVQRLLSLARPKTL